MTATVSPVTEGDIDALVMSVAGLFAEDAGRHDPGMDLRWPEREGAAYYSQLQANRPGLPEDPAPGGA
jgi:hypothetical protein